MGARVRSVAGRSDVSESVGSGQNRGRTSEEEQCLRARWEVVELVSSRISSVFSCWSLRENLRALVAPPQQRLGVFDFIRGSCIVWITAFHLVWLAPHILGRRLRPEEAPWYMNRPLQFADLGVDAFFVLSGLLVGGLLMTKYCRSGRLEVGRFYLARAFRILPVYYALVLLWVVGGGPNSDTAWSNLLFVNNFVPLERQVLPTAWSLAIEGQFYLVAPLIVGWLLRLGPRASLVVCTAMVASSIGVRFGVLKATGLPPTALHHFFQAAPTSTAEIFAYHDAFYDKPYTRFGSLAAGLLGAVIEVHYRKQLVASLRRPAVAVGIVAVFLAIGAVIATSSPSAVVFCSFRTAFGVALCAVLLLIIHGPAWGVLRLVRSFVNSRVWFPIAELSYSAYLCQLLVIGAWFEGLKEAPGAPSVVAVIEESFLPALGATFAMAFVLYLLVEKPARNLYVLLQRPARVRAAYGA